MKPKLPPRVLYVTLESIREEIDLVHRLLLNPAGYDLDLYGGILCVRSTDQETFEVEWDVDVGSIDMSRESNADKKRESQLHAVQKVLAKHLNGYRSFKSPLRAAATFVHLRHRWQIGEDYVSAACIAAGVSPT